MLGRYCKDKVQNKAKAALEVASFPNPAQLSVTCSTEQKAGRGPGRAILEVLVCNVLHGTCGIMTVVM